MKRFLCKYLLFLVILLFLAPQAHSLTLDPSAGLSPGDIFHWAFVTMGTVDANSPDISDYNDFVNDQAHEVGSLTEDVTGEWKAIVSTPDVDAVDNVNIQGPVYLVDGLNGMANDSSDMFDGSLAWPINTTQYGNLILADVWTGSLIDGRAESGYSLGDTTGEALFGYSAGYDYDWISVGYRGVDDQLPLYAISSPQEVPAAIPEPTTMLLMGIGMIGFAGFRRRFKKS